MPATGHGPYGSYGPRHRVVKAAEDCPAVCVVRRLSLRFSQSGRQANQASVTEPHKTALSQRGHRDTLVRDWLVYLKNLGEGLSGLHPGTKLTGVNDQSGNRRFHCIDRFQR